MPRDLLRVRGVFFCSFSFHVSFLFWPEAALDLPGLRDGIGMAGEHGCRFFYAKSPCSSSTFFSYFLFLCSFLETLENELHGMVLPGVLASQPCHGTVGWLVRRYETGTGDMETWRHGDMDDG